MFSNIYIITNKINNKKYVGQTINPKKRWSAHKYEGIHYNYTNIALYNAMKKYGVENFEFKVIESNIDINEINDRETFWIKKINTYKPNGYNLTFGGEGLQGFKMSKESKDKLSKIAKERYDKLSDKEKIAFINRLPKDGYDLNRMNEGFKLWQETVSIEEKKAVYEKATVTKKDKHYDFYSFSFGKMSEEEKNRNV